MTIEITKTVVVKEEINKEELKVSRGQAKDIDSVNLTVEYKGEEIAEGHLNNRTNFAHITINEGLMNEEDECDLIDYLVDGIENRTINLQ